MLSPQQLEEGQRSPVGGWAEPRGVRFRAAVGVSVRSHGSLRAEAAAVVVRIRHAGCGRPGSLWYGSVDQRPGRRHGPAAVAVLRSVWDVHVRFNKALLLLTQTLFPIYFAFH